MTEHRTTKRISTSSGHILSYIPFGKIFGTRIIGTRVSADRQSMIYVVSSG